METLFENQIGEKITPILEELEMTILENQINLPNLPPNYPTEALPAACVILSSVIMDKMWILQKNEKMTDKNRLEMAQYVGTELRKLIKVATGIDTHKIFKNE